MCMKSQYSGDSKKQENEIAFVCHTTRQLLLSGRKFAEHTYTIAILCYRNAEMSSLMFKLGLTNYMYMYNIYVQHVHDFS